MPSPFPGMDPYLEHPAGWMGFHNKLIGEIEGALNAQLMPAYYADSEDRVYISNESDPGRKAIIPDIKVVYTGRPGKRKPTGGNRASVGVAVCEPVTVTTLLDDEIHEPYLTVIERASGRVVTVIEVLSPTNKTAGSVGREAYTAKKSMVMRSDTNWVEIDLLRDGVPVFAREGYPPCEYLVHVSKRSGRPNGVVWPIRLQQRLPEILIPLKGDDPDAKLDLQPLLDAVYDRGPYSVKLKYKADPTPPLPPELAKWADALLRKKKLR
ncbi:MAG TPA: DUF4058 family protein [Urbifossiella sp.]|nr:DUF4058 family protein [Urbifossiella sp.]